MIDLKRVIIIILIIIIVILLITTICKFVKNSKDMKIAEFVPEEEITEEQLRKTMVTLYFRKEDALVPEGRIIDAKELLDNPYETLLKLLINGPKNTSLKGTIPEGTRILEIKKENDVLKINFSKEFIENHPNGEIEENITIKSIVSTLTELTEINGIKILIEGEENKSFKDNIIKFDNIFKNK